MSANLNKLAVIQAAMANRGYRTEAKTLSQTTRGLIANTQLTGIIKNNKGPKGRTSLMYAAKQGDIARVTFLLKEGANPNEEDRDLHSVLYWAAVGGNREVIRLLVERGAQLNYKNRWGNTALHYAASYGNVGAVRVLIEAGANVDEKNQDEKTPLMNTLEPSMVRVRTKPSEETKAEIIRILLNAHSDINMKNQQGSTALAMASSSGNVEAVTMLCDAGADVNTRDNDGSTPLISLITNIQYINTPNDNVEQILEILLSRGANPDMADERGRTLEMFINGYIDDDDFKENLLTRIASARGAHGPVGSGGTQGGGSRKMKGRKTRGKGKKGKAKAKAKGKTRKARS